MRLFCLAVVLLFSFSAHATQFGFAITTTDGDAEADESGNPFINNFDVSTAGVNFTLNACEGCGAFFYRLHVGLSEGEIKYGGISDDIRGISTTNSFAFKLASNDSVDVWIGPSLFASSWEVDGDFSDDDRTFAWGWGPTVGIDFKLKSGSTIALELSLRKLKADIDTDAFEDYDIDDMELQLSFLF